MTFQGDEDRLEGLLASVGQLRFYLRPVVVAEGVRPLNPENPECKWYVERLHGKRHALPTGASTQSRLLLALQQGQLHAVDVPELGVTVLRPAMKLTGLFKGPKRRQVWRQALPWTTECVRLLNKSVSKILHVPPCTWTQAVGRSGVMGNAYDYAVGSLWAGDDLRGVFRRVRVATARLPGVRAVAASLEQMLRKQFDAAGRGASVEVDADYFRGLVLLAELDAMSRAIVDPPRWIPRFEPGPITQARLRRHLKENYPDEVAGELSDLLRTTDETFVTTEPRAYNPEFGGVPGFEHIGADGDLIVGDTLFELKASTRAYTCEHLWQLLGYACLDRLHGRQRIRRVGFFNPRRRHLWSEDLERFVALLALLRGVDPGVAPAQRGRVGPCRLFPTLSSHSSGGPASSISM